MFAWTRYLRSRYLRRDHEQDPLSILALGLYFGARAVSRANDQDPCGDGPTFARDRSGNARAIPDRGIFPEPHQTHAQTLFLSKRLLYRTIQSIVKLLLYPGSSGSRLTFRCLVASENRSTIHYAGLRRNRYQAVAAILMFHESGTGSCAYLRLRRLVSGANSRRPD